MHDNFYFAHLLPPVLYNITMIRTCSRSANLANQPFNNPYIPDVDRTRSNADRLERFWLARLDTSDRHQLQGLPARHHQPTSPRQTQLQSAGANHSKQGCPGSSETRNATLSTRLLLSFAHNQRHTIIVIDRHRQN